MSLKNWESNKERKERKYYLFRASVHHNRDCGELTKYFETMINIYTHILIRISVSWTFGEKPKVVLNY